MHRSKPIKLLKTLTEEEFRRFYKFCRSPFYHNNKKLNELFDILRKYAPKYESPRLQKETVFKKLFPGDSFDMNKMRKLMTAFSQLVEEFLVVLELEDQTFRKKTLLKDALGKRNNFSLFEKMTFDLITEQEATPFRNRAYYREMLDLHEEYYYHPEAGKTNIKSDYILQAMKNLDLYFGLGKLQLGLEMKVREKTLQEQYPIWLLEQLTEQSQDIFYQNPVIEMYIGVLNLHEELFSIEQFRVLKIKFQQTIHLLDRIEKLQLFYHLLNYCIQQVNKGDNRYKEEVFAFYKVGLDHHIIIQKGQITELTFTNIVAIGSSLQHYNWVLSFIKTYTPYLEESIREDINSLSLAFLHFNKKDFHQSINLLINYHFKNIITQTQSRNLLIRCYFEQFLMDENFFDFLIDQINAFDKFLRRQKRINKNKKKAVLNFLKFTKKIASCKMQQGDFEVIKNQILNSGLITNQQWLLDKTDA